MKLILESWRNNFLKEGHFSNMAANFVTDLVIGGGLYTLHYLIGAYRERKEKPTFAKMHRYYFTKIMAGILKDKECLELYNKKAFPRLANRLSELGLFGKYESHVDTYAGHLYERAGKIKIIYEKSDKFSHKNSLEFERKIDKDDLFDLNVPAFQEKYGKYFDTGY